MADVNGNGHSASLATLAGAKVRYERRVTFEVSSLEQALETIRKLGEPGQLTINFANGRPAGTAEWRSVGYTEKS